MNARLFRTVITYLLLCLYASIAFSTPFNIFIKPGTTLPTSINGNNNVLAYYTIQNNTKRVRINNFVKYLPDNVTQVTSQGTYPDTCSNTFTLQRKGTSGSSCTLQLAINGPVNENNDDPRRHLIVCFIKGISCAGTNDKLNVTTSTSTQLTHIIIAPTSPTVPINSTQQFTATAIYGDNSQANITNLATWQITNNHATINGTGLLTGQTVGNSQVTATFNGLTSNIANVSITNPLISLAVTPANQTIVIGTTQQFTATGTYADTSTQNLTGTVTWSTNNGHASIDASGLATGVSVGSTTVQASLSGVNGNTTLTINNPLVSIAISPTNPTVAINSTQQFTAIGTYADSSTQNITSSVTWSANNGHATINSTGLATGVSVGSTTIQATLSGITSNTTTLTVNNPLVSIAVTPSNQTIAIAATQQFTATGTYADASTQNLTGTVTWSTNNGHASIDASGLATGVSVGSTTVQATLSGVNGSTTLTINNPLVSIDITPNSATLAINATQQLTATGTYADNSTQNITNTVTWQSSHPSVSINSSGLATGVSTGTATITATLSGITSSSGALLTVNNPLVSIAITPTNATINLSTTQQYAATGTFADNSTQNITNTVTWSSSDTNVATINSSTGLATSVGTGTTTISATLSGVTNTIPATLTIQNPLQSIAVTPANVTISQGATQQYTATGTYANSATQDITNSVTWSSLNGHATIDVNGLATGVSVGSTTITATLSGISGNTTLTINNPLVSIAITPTSNTITPGETVQYTATGTYADSSTQDITNTAIWDSTSTATATISSSGLATAVALGSTTITATLSGVTSNSATIGVVAYAYITNYNNDTVSLCRVNANNTISDCQTTGSDFFGPREIIINNAKTRLYTQNETASNSTFCDINSDYTLTNCQTTANTEGLIAPISIMFSNDGSKAYFGNTTSTTSLCTVNVDGTISGCATTGSGFNFVVSMTINPTGTFAYFANLGNNSISKCSIAIDGTLNSCASTGSAILFPSNIHHHASLNTLYVVRNENNTIQKCDLDGSGDITGCTQTPSAVTFTDPVGFGLNSTSTKAFITLRNDNQIAVCDIDGSGELNNCTTSTPTTLNQPYDIRVTF